MPPGDDNRGGPFVIARSSAMLRASAHALRLVHEHDRYPSWWPLDPEAWLSPDGIEQAWVVERSGTVLGHVCVVGNIHDPVAAAAAGVPTDRLLSVSRLFVVPEARGLNLGAQLLAAARAFSDSRNAQLMLDVVDDDGPAARLYERLGWRMIDRRPADWVTPAGRRYDVLYYLAPDEPRR